MITAHAQQPAQLNVCHAGSLTAAFTPVEREFEREHPGVKVVDTAGGSVDLARRFAAGRLPCDVYAPADHLVIDTLLEPSKLADYSIVFAHGRMVLAYLATDPKAAKLPVTGTFQPPASIPQVAAGWDDVLTMPGVRMAGAHPFMDPGGYRSHMLFELAQAALKKPGLYNALLSHYQVNVADPTGATPAPALGKDFNFQTTYEHSALTAASTNPAYRFARLPDSIDLSSDAPGRYAASRITIPGAGIPGAPASVTIPASRTEWGITLAATTPSRDLAVAFVALLLGPTGRAALESHGPAPLVPARVTPSDAPRLPPALQRLVSTEN
ncbi:MAG TPA: extracellular solute-binding protein [Vicinamibacterales bacterium]|nr:extracellular solute-binding protein [Vicinamibacterales bacterium]